MPNGGAMRSVVLVANGQGLCVRVEKFDKTFNRRTSARMTQNPCYMI